MASLNPNSFNPFDHQQYEWNGRTMVPRPTNAADIRQKIAAHRNSSLWKPVHIPVEELDYEL